MVILTFCLVIQEKLIKNAPSINEIVSSYIKSGAHAKNLKFESDESDESSSEEETSVTSKPVVQNGNKIVSKKAESSSDDSSSDESTITNAKKQAPQQAKAPSKGKQFYIS